MSTKVTFQTQVISFWRVQQNLDLHCGTLRHVESLEQCSKFNMFTPTSHYLSIIGLRVIASNVKSISKEIKKFY